MQALAPTPSSNKVPWSVAWTQLPGSTDEQLIGFTHLLDPSSLNPLEYCTSLPLECPPAWPPLLASTNAFFWVTRPLIYRQSSYLISQPKFSPFCPFSPTPSIKANLICPSAFAFSHAVSLPILLGGISLSRNPIADLFPCGLFSQNLPVLSPSSDS